MVQKPPLQPRPNCSAACKARRDTGSALVCKRTVGQGLEPPAVGCSSAATKRCRTAVGLGSSASGPRAFTSTTQQQAASGPSPNEAVDLHQGRGLVLCGCTPQGSQRGVVTHSIAASAVERKAANVPSQVPAPATRTEMKMHHPKCPTCGKAASDSGSR